MPSNNTAEVCAIIVTYNALPWIDKCIKSLLNSNIKASVYIIDNNSTDGTQLHIQNNYPDIRLIQNKANVGFGKANNIGFQIALEEQKDFVLLLNQDAYLFPNTLGTLIEAYQKSPDYYIISPIFLQKDEVTLEHCFEQYIQPALCPGLISDFIANQRALKPVYEIKYIHAAIWFLPIECIKNIGGFDPLFPHNGEDNDYMNRVRHFGKKIGICPHTKAVHDNESQTSPNFMMETFKKQKRFYYNTFLHIQKNINTKFLHGYLRATWLWSKLLVANMAKLKAKGSIAILLAYFGYLIKLPRIKQHYSMSKKANSPFLA